MPVEILSGEQEADWAFRGVISDPVFASHPLLIVDAGGGSTEFILGEGDRQRFRHSFRLGTVRLIEQLPHADPPARADWDRCRSVVNDFLAQQIRPVIQAELGMFPSRAVQLVGTGGTPGILARIALKLPRFNREKIEAVRLTLQTVQQQRERLWAAPLAERKNIAGLPPDRADVILAGVAIYEALMEQFDFPDLRVSTRGLRFAAVMEEGVPG